MGWGVRLRVAGEVHIIEPAARALRLLWRRRFSPALTYASPVQDLVIVEVESQTRDAQPVALAIVTH